VKRRVLGFIDLLRREGLNPGPGETLDALRAVAAAGVERGVLRESLAATLVKDHAERSVFDAAFDRYFALPARSDRPRKRPGATGAGDGGSGAGTAGAGQGTGRRLSPDAAREGQATGEAAHRPSGSSESKHALSPVEGVADGGGPEEESRRIESGGELERSAEALAKRRALMVKPFREMEPREIEELRDLARDLARRFRRRCARRMRGGKRGRLDIRRTLRRALSRGGVPIELFLRRRRPGRADLVALVDLSFSTARAADFLLAVLAPAHRYFRSATLLAYVDRPVEISFEGGHVVPHGPLDLNARSDFGSVLARLVLEHGRVIGRDTVLLLLGDARNNRRPPRADLLARLHREVRAVAWLNPEPRARWDTGDSVMTTYAKHADLVLEAESPGALVAALGRVASLSIH
jgi:hypothetical protein